MNRILAGLMILATLTGCERRHSEAVVLEKEHIAVQAPTPTPTLSTSNQPVTEENTLPETVKPGPRPSRNCGRWRRTKSRSMAW